MYLRTHAGLGQAPMVVTTPDGPVTCDPNVSYPDGHPCASAASFWDIEQFARWGRLYPSDRPAPTMQTLERRTPATTGPPPPFELKEFIRANQTPLIAASLALVGLSMLGGRRG